MTEMIYKTMYYIVDVGIDPELICSRLGKASQFYNSDSQTLCYNKFKNKMVVCF